MNQIIQFLLLFGVVGVFFVVIYDTMIDDVSTFTLSQQDKINTLKIQTQEDLKLIEIITTSPAIITHDNNTIIDVINIGNHDIVVDKIFINGIESKRTCKLNDEIFSAPLLIGKISRITCSDSGTSITIVTQNNKAFWFGHT